VTIDAHLVVAGMAWTLSAPSLLFMARVPRCEFPDGSFHIGARGVARMPIYLDDEDRRAFLRLLGLMPARFGWTFHAFCLMTNHYHLVVDSTRERLSLGLHTVNGLYAQGFNGKYERWGHVFGDRFWSRSLQEDDLERTCTYVMENPVRAGLCKHARDWPWSACRYTLD
jgi:putative transposase